MAGRKTKFRKLLAINEDYGGRANGDRQIPDRVTSEHWAYKKIAELSQKYATDKKLPEGRSCSKGELAESLFLVMNNVVAKHDKEGAQAIRRDDLENIASLQNALEDELSKQGTYRMNRKSVEEILVMVEPEEPAIQYKLGVNGFLRSDVVGNFRLPDSGFTPGRNEERIVCRVKPYAYWHPADWQDIHLEGQGCGFSGGDQHFRRFSLYQGFVEVKLPGSDLLSLTGGRYAAPWADGVKGNLLGAYATYAPSKDDAIEAYVFRDTGSEERKPGEHLYTFGFRSTSILGPLAVEFEPVLQNGKVLNPDTGLNDDIKTYGGSYRPDRRGQTG